MTLSVNTGTLPDDLTGRILRMLGDDGKFDLRGVVNGTDATPEQIATYAARLAFEGGWQGRMELSTRDRITVECENHFAPPEAEAVDPLMEMATAFNARSAFARSDELEDPANTVVIHPPAPMKIIDTRPRS
jgi:hypothetical protein